MTWSSRRHDGRHVCGRVDRRPTRHGCAETGALIAALDQVASAVRGAGKPGDQ